MKHLLLALTLVLSSEAWAAQKCGAFLKQQTEIEPIARIIFSAEGNQDHSLVFSRKKTILSAEFTKSFLTGLRSFFAGKSTTTSRLEERAVIKESESKELLDSSELDWKPRDQKKEGEDFTTITTYSGKFMMDSGSDVGVSAKLRARKYFSHDAGESDTSKMKSVFGDVGSLEIKISNIAGVEADGFTAFPNSVFKPRVFISDASLKKLSKMNHQKLSAPDAKTKLVEELFFLEVAGVQMNKDLGQIESFVDAVTLLLQENPNLFEVQTVVAYNRDSYSAALDADTEYQYTLDRNIRIFEPDSSLNASDIISYLDRTPLHKVEDGVAFAELKSPMIEKTENTPTYQTLSNALFSRHRASFVEGKGKHSLGSKIRATIAQTTLSEQLHTEGLLFYLIKGVGNLPKPPNRKHLVELGTWDIAMPLTISGKDHRIIFGYERNSGNGVKTQVLNSIRLVDSLGRKVNLDPGGAKDIIAAALSNPDPSTIYIDNQAITFPSVIKEDVVDQFTDFFDRFYTGYGKGQANPREIESLFAVNSRSSLATYTRRMKIGNFLAWLKDRVFKHAPQVIMTAAFIASSTILVKMNAKPAPESYINAHQIGLQGTVNLVVQGEGYSTGLVGVVMPDGKIQILAVEPNPATPKTNLAVDISTIEQVQINSESAENAGAIIVNKEVKQEAVQ